MDNCGNLEDLKLNQEESMKSTLNALMFLLVLKKLTGSMIATRSRGRRSQHLKLQLSLGSPELCLITDEMMM